MAMNTIEKAKPISLNDLEKLKSEIEQSIKALVSNIPKGAIMWFNLTSAPTGWVVCDGNNGTPDLRGRYPLGAVSGIGTTVSAGLPNITGTIGPILEEAAYGKYTDGAFYQTTETGTGHAGGDDYIVKMDASRCSSVYGNSTTVTPPSVKLLPCMKL
ncbi:MAG: tail fiber protein [Clostridia bacterium]|nr:tail fiber protein [Clostridia bacterium]